MAHDLTEASNGPASLHADKFRVTIAALVGLAIGAIAVAVAVIVAHSNNSGSTSANAQLGSTLQWSSWKPSQTGNEGAEEIADYIAPFYRLDASQQLALITPISTTQLDEGTGSFTGSGLTVAVNTGSSGSSTASLAPLEGQTVAYDICGQGNAKCAVAGKPSQDRELLLRREALELALYTFKYLPKAQNVAVVLPPGKTTEGSSSKPLTVAVLFLRSSISPSLLTQPIDETLQEIPPTMSTLKTWSKSEEAELVDTITARNLFSEKVESEQDEGNLLVLDPLPAQ